MGPALVCTDPAEAAEAVVAGRDVVLLTSSPEAAGQVRGAGPGRMAVLVGDPDDARDLAAAAEMAAEVFARKNAGCQAPPPAVQP